MGRQLVGAQDKSQPICSAFFGFVLYGQGPSSLYEMGQHRRRMILPETVAFVLDGFDFGKLLHAFRSVTHYWSGSVGVP